MKLTERQIEDFIKRGSLLGEFCIQNDLAEVDDALKLAALSVRTTPINRHSRNSKSKALGCGPGALGSLTRTHNSR
jgi:hypothetical protein